jgi:hypothetical protein
MTRGRERNMVDKRTRHEYHDSTTLWHADEENNTQHPVFDIGHISRRGSGITPFCRLQIEVCRRERVQLQRPSHGRGKICVGRHACQGNQQHPLPHGSSLHVRGSSTRGAQNGAPRYGSVHGSNSRKQCACAVSYRSRVENADLPSGRT